MNDLIMVGFKDEYKAETVLSELEQLKQIDLTDLEDAAIVVCDLQGHVTINQEEFGKSGGLQTGFWELLIGMIFLYPVPAYFSKASSVMLRVLANMRIDQTFVQSSRKAIEPGTSAIFMLAKESRQNKVLDALSRVEGKLLQTFLFREDKEKIASCVNESMTVG